MKTTKKLIAVILCIATILSLGAVSASALEIGDYIEWGSEDGDYIYYLAYAGELTEGVNEIEVALDSYAAYEFTAPETGYYEFYSLGCWTNMAEKYENNIAYDYNGAYTCWTNDDRLVELYYLTEGTTLVEVYNYDDGASIEIAYAGNITDAVAEEGALDCLIIGENSSVEDGETVWVSPFNHYLKMDTGKDYAPDDYSWSFELKDGYTKGENTLIYKFNDFEKEFTAKIYEITDFISSVEIENIEPYLETYDYYDGCFDYCDLGETPEEITVTFTDGTVETIVYNYTDEENYCTSVVLPNGVECYIYSYYTADSENREFILEIANHAYIEEKCNITKLGFTENMNHFKENISSILIDYKYHLEWCFEGIMGYGYNEPFYYIPELFDTVYLKIIFNNIGLLFDFFLF